MLPKKTWLPKTYQSFSDTLSSYYSPPPATTFLNAGGWYTLMGVLLAACSVHTIGLVAKPFPGLSPVTTSVATQNIPSYLF